MRRASSTIAGGACLALCVVLLPAASPLTRGQEAALARTLVCPERLPDDAARLAQATRFVAAYGRLHPKSRMGERAAARDRILKAKRCRPETLQYSFPET